MGFFDMKWLLSTVAAALIVSAASSVSADDLAGKSLTGKALAEGCQKKTLELIACLAYIEGYSDGFVSNDRIATTYLKENVRSGHLAVAAKAKRVEKPAYCADDEIPAERLRVVYLDWAEANPEALDQPAASALFRALSEAYPCSGPPAGSPAYQTVSLRP